jgi:hypothetical protein
VPPALMHAAADQAVPGAAVVALPRYGCALRWHRLQ